MDGRLTPNVSIRPAEARDAAIVRACAQAAYTPYVARIGRDPAPMVADFEGLIAAGQVYVAEDAGNTFLGFVVFFIRGETLFLENIAVDPKATGQGVGRALIVFCEDQGRQAGCARVALYTNVKMTENLTLYPHLGYVETGTRIEDGFRRVYFEKRL